jgi:cobalt-precorrin-5B (C1)-methyltransferase
MLIYAEVKKTEKRPDLTSENVIICGGEGVGRVTKAGLNQPIGEAAINSGPRRMITEAVMEICGSEDVLEVIISVPGGLEASEKTFNPVLGIEGGISILGSTGIVEPMSEPAIIETIRAEMRVKWLETDEDYLVIVPGNYGMSFVKEKLGISESRIIKCSNFIGEAIDCACELGVKKLLIAGNLGKLVKLAGGIFNTHSRNADCRMDILMRCAFSAMKENDCIMICDILKRLDECVTTDAAAAVLKDADILDETMKVVTSKAMQHIQRRCRNFEDNAPLIRLIIS